MIAALIALSVAATQPDPATLIYYNARLALRDRQPTDAVKMWLLRNALQSKTKKVSEHDNDFRTATWVALAELGFCQDGLQLDSDGAGLWPLALHNWFLRNMRRGEPAEQAAPFDAFDIARQQRFVSLQDVLSVEELKTVRFYRTHCYRMKDALVAADLSAGADQTDRKVQLRVLTALLRAARHTVAKSHVVGRSTIDARLLDIRLKEVELLEQTTRRAYRNQKRKVRALGSNMEPAEDVARSKSMRKLLAVAESWNATDWLAIEPERRLYLYSWVHRAGLVNSETHLALIDKLADRREGKDLQDLLSFTGTQAQDKRAVWSKARGQRLLALDTETGFKERAALALHRGVDAVGAGDLPDALREFAQTLRFAADSKDGDAIRRLGLRWLSYVAGRFQVTDELVTMLSTLVPRGDLAEILEDLMWDAAFAADRTSFDRALSAHRGRGGLRQRSLRLESLASGDAGAFLAQTKKELTEAPHASLRFLKRFLERLETQDGDVRAQHRDLLVQLREALFARIDSLPGGLARKAGGLEAHAGALLGGLTDPVVQNNARERARGLSPTTEIFAGSIRMAPSDKLPWPFRIPNIRPPSVFKPLPITPVEWRRNDQLVMGWKLGQ